MKCRIQRQVAPEKAANRAIRMKGFAGRARAGRFGEEEKRGLPLSGLLPSTPTNFQSLSALAGQTAFAGFVSVAAGLFRGFETHRAGLAVEVTAAGYVKDPRLGVAAVGRRGGGLDGDSRFFAGWAGAAKAGAVSRSAAAKEGMIADKQDRMELPVFDDGMCVLLSEK